MKCNKKFDPWVLKNEERIRHPLEMGSSLEAAKNNLETVSTELRLLADGSMVGSRIFSHYLANQRNIDVKSVIVDEIREFMKGGIDNGKVHACRDKCLSKVRDMDLKTNETRMVQISYMDVTLELACSFMEQETHP